MLTLNVVEKDTVGYMLYASDIYKHVSNRDLDVHSDDIYTGSILTSCNRWKLVQCNQSQCSYTDLILSYTQID